MIKKNFIFLMGFLSFLFIFNASAGPAAGQGAQKANAEQAAQAAADARAAQQASQGADAAFQQANQKMTDAQDKVNALKEGGGTIYERARAEREAREARDAAAEAAQVRRQSRDAARRAKRAADNAALDAKSKETSSVGENERFKEIYQGKVGLTQNSPGGNVEIRNGANSGGSGKSDSSNCPT